MAHFAELNDNNEVINVIVVHNNELLDENGNESETKGIGFCISHFGGRWIQTSYNANFRKNMASKGYFYDEVRDAFIYPQPYNSWILNEETCQWMPPVDYPIDGLQYSWDENQIKWIQKPQPNSYYDEELGRFIEPKPSPSAILNLETYTWEPPIPYPNDGLHYRWDEDTKSWVEITS